MNFENVFNNEKILAAVFLLILAAGGGFIVWKNYSGQPQTSPTACTQEAKICPDGSAVGRTGPNCDFALCPSVALCEGGTCPSNSPVDILAAETDLASGFGNGQVGKAIMDYLLTQKQFSWKTAPDSFNFCAVKNLQPENELFPYYVWAYCAEYAVRDGKPILLSGTSLPVKIDHPNELSFYAPGKFTFEAPRDGSFNGPDIERIFPKDARGRFAEFDPKITTQKMEALVLAAASAWESIKQAVADCQAAKATQTHDKNVGLELEDGAKLTAIEPRLHDITAAIEAARSKCGDIPIATE